MPIIPIIRSGGSKSSGSNPTLGEITVKTTASGYYVDIYGGIVISDGKVRTESFKYIGNLGRTVSIADANGAISAFYIVAKPNNPGDEISEVTGNSGGTAKSVPGIGWIIPVESGDTVSIRVIVPN